MPYNVAAGSFRTKKLCSKLSSKEGHFLVKTVTCIFDPPLGMGLMGNVPCSSKAHWKARSRLPILTIIGLCSPGIMVEALRANIDWESTFLKGVGHFGTKF